MVILILAEPRSGSTNLANWFNSNKNFTVLQEPLNKNGLNFKEKVPPHQWEYDTDYLLIKEIYTPTTNLEELINLADKVILLYRDNVKEQLESWLVAISTNQWSSEWVSNRVVINNKDYKVGYFNKLKSGFKNDYLNNPKFFKISYEELYSGDGIEKVIDYLNIDSVENKDFPYGKRYRININKPNTLI
jgi:hypothetical protein